MLYADSIDRYCRTFLPSRWLVRSVLTSARMDGILQPTLMMILNFAWKLRIVADNDQKSSIVCRDPFPRNPFHRKRHLIRSITGWLRCPQRDHLWVQKNSGTAQSFTSDSESTLVEARAGSLSQSIWSLNQAIGECQTRDASTSDLSKNPSEGPFGFFSRYFVHYLLLDLFSETDELVLKFGRGFNYGSMSISLVAMRRIYWTS